MSSIYDALKRIQGERHSRLFPPPREGVAPGQARRRMLLVLAVSLCLVCVAGAITAVVFVKWGDHPAGRQMRAGDQGSGMNAGIPAAALPDDGRTGHSDAGKTPAAALRAEPAVPENVEDYIRQGEQHYTAQEYDKALAAYIQAMRFFRRDPRLLNNIGIVMLAKGEPEKAVNYFRQAKSQSGRSVEPVYNLACAYARLGDENQAISYLKTACTMNPEARDWAARDPDLLILEGTEDFDELVGAQ